MSEEKKIPLYTNESPLKKEIISLINEALKEGWVIDTINCDNCNEYEVEADLIIYLKR